MNYHPHYSDDPTDPDFAKHTVTNDAVAGEQVIDSGAYGGPVGAEPMEAEPVYFEHDPQTERVDLDDRPDDGNRS
jgi:hypothetical protein